MSTKGKLKNREVARQTSIVLDDLPFHLPRVFYAFLGLVERRLKATGLDQHLRPGMPTILFALYEEDDCILKVLKGRVMLAHNTLSTLLRRMEDAGLVTCRPCEEDGRATRVTLTELGRSLRNPLIKFHQGVTATLESGFKEGESAILRKSLSRLLESIRNDEREEFPTRAAKKKER